MHSDNFLITTPFNTPNGEESDYHFPDGIVVYFY